MRFKIFLLATIAATASAAHADSQSSNTSSNSSSNNGVVRERVVDSYCENGRCERTVTRSVYRDDDRANYGKRKYASRDDDRRKDDDDRYEDD